MESRISNARYTFWDSDSGEGGAAIESIRSNARYAFGDCNRGEGGATIESLISNARDAVGCSVIGNGFGDSGDGYRGRSVSHLYGVRCGTASDVVVQVISRQKQRVPLSY